MRTNTSRLQRAWVASRVRIQIGLWGEAAFSARRLLDSSRMTLVSIVSFRCALGTLVNGWRTFYLNGIVADVVTERGVVGKRVLWQLNLILCVLWLPGRCC